MASKLCSLMLKKCFQKKESIPYALLINLLCLGFRALLLLGCSLHSIIIRLQPVLQPSVYLATPTYILTIIYSQFAFQAMAAVDNQNFIFFSSLDNSTNYAVYKNRDMFISFSVELSQQQNEKQEYIYINVTSTSDTEMRLVASAVHQFDSQTYSLTKAQPENTFFVHKQVPNVNKRVKFEIDSQDLILVWVCSAPILMNIIWFDCKFCKSQEGSIIYTDIDIADFDYQKDYIFYSVEQNGADNGLIKASIVDVNEIGADSHHDIQIQVKVCGSEKKDNNWWIILDVAVGVLVAYGIAVCVFFFMRHKKQTNIHTNEENEAILGEK
ncbi:Hypothetical_protein [Hexamita inflata]|uniref:Hypothetical_protein n=1 Tax=Hexamita inflata TaxID=28002 RepID=A0ABP1H6C6_9EUKA